MSLTTGEFNSEEFKKRECCPVCEDPAIKRCNCYIGDRECENGHKWHVCAEHGLRIVGSGHEAEPDARGHYFECSCPLEKRTESFF